MSKPPAPLSLWSSPPSQTPRICSIAGSDSGGGAGIQADLKTILALGGYGLSVVTALTAQNTTGVTGIHVPPVEFLRQQMRSVREDIRVDAWKVGMLANAEVVQAVAEELNRGQEGEAGMNGLHAPVVLDPVMVSTSGSLLLPHEAIQTLIKKLLPTCALLTPNLPEAEQLLAHASAKGEAPQDGAGSSKQPLHPPQSLKTLQDRLEAAKKLSDLGPRAVLLKGGHQAVKRREVDEALLALGVDARSGDRKRCDEIRRDLFGDKRSPISALDAGAEIQVSSTSSSSSTAYDLIVIRSDGYPYSPVLRSLISPNAESEDESVVIDILYTTSTRSYTLFINPSLPHSCTHGTGCTLSSALATHLGASGIHLDRKEVEEEGEAAKREDRALRRACWRSIAYVQAAIVRGYEDLGKGPGALDHAVSVAPRGVLLSTAEGVARGDVDVDDAEEQGGEEKGDVMERYANLLASSPSPSRPRTLGAQPLPLITSLLSRSRASWEGYVWHEFVQRLALHFRPTAAATSANISTATSSSPSSKPLPLRSFLHFLKQDYHFLLHYSRLWSLSASSASSFSEAQYFLSLAAGMAAEAQGHVALCSGKAFGVTKRQLEAEQEGAAVMAYTRFVLDVAHKEGAAGLETMVVTMPCLLGYADMGERLRQADRELNGGVELKADAQPTSLPASLRTWYRQYTSPEYLTAVKAGLVKMESLAAGLGQPGGEKMEKLQGLWDMAVRLERGMWDEALRVGEEH